jgi:ribosome assembly protein RRB1
MPGQKLAEGEVLEADPNAYVMLHQMTAEWPCLSFDILPDKLGHQRTKV